MAAVYFMVPISTTVDTTYDRAFTAGRKGLVGTISTDCTDDSMGAVTGFTGSVYESSLFFTHEASGVNRLENVLFIGARPLAGKPITAMSTAGDDTCVQGGVTYQRYSGNIV